MELNEYEKSATRFHLGFNAGAQIPAGDSFINLSVTPQGQASAVVVKSYSG